MCISRVHILCEKDVRNKGGEVQPKDIGEEGVIKEYRLLNVESQGG